MKVINTHDETIMAMYKRYENLYKIIDVFLENRPDGHILIYDFNVTLKLEIINKARPDLTNKIAIIQAMQKKEINIQDEFLDEHILVLVNP